jgi:hypothetical protein
MAGAFSARAGHGEEDAIAFTHASAELVFQYLKHHAVRCVWVTLSAGQDQIHSLILAGDDRGIERGLRAAKKIAMSKR